MQPDARHTAYLEGLKAQLAGPGADIPADQLLAVTAQFLGMLIAVQDRRAMGGDRAMKIVAANIEIGNQTAIDGLLPSAGHA